MSEPTRDDLYVWDETIDDYYCEHRRATDKDLAAMGYYYDMSEPMGELWIRKGVGHYIEATDADLAAMGYAKVDSVDLAQIREGLEAYRRSDHLSAALLWVRLVSQVLDGMGES